VSKVKHQNKQDAYTSNLLISLLMRFPEIMSINFDMPHDQAKFTFILAGDVRREDVSRFAANLKESLAAFAELTGEKLMVKSRLHRSGRLNLLELNTNTTALSLEAIQLVCGLVAGVFTGSLVTESDNLDYIHEDEMMRQEEIIDYLLSHGAGAHKDNLLAFREAGKVFVIDK
jgi:hypothetical protein